MTHVANNPQCVVPKELRMEQSAKAQHVVCHHTSPLLQIMIHAISRYFIHGAQFNLCGISMFNDSYFQSVSQNVWNFKTCGTLQRHMLALPSIIMHYKNICIQDLSEQNAM